MKLSESTVEILKNFSTINQGLIVKPGKVLRTLSNNRAIMAEAQIDEEFESEFGIYDLNKTLGLLSMTKGVTPEIKIEKEFLTFSGLGKIRQRFTAINLIFGHDRVGKTINISTFDVNFVLTPEIHNWIFSVASILKCPEIIIRSGEYDPKTDSRPLELAALDVKGLIVDDASVTIAGVNTLEFTAVLKIENLKILSGAYDVFISRNGISKFIHKDKKILYWISLEKTSKFEGK
jgi:hypothetical protein